MPQISGSRRIPTCPRCSPGIGTDRAGGFGPFAGRARALVRALDMTRTRSPVASSNALLTASSRARGSPRFQPMRGTDDSGLADAACGATTPLTHAGVPGFQSIRWADSLGPRERGCGQLAGEPAQRPVKVGVALVHEGVHGLAVVRRSRRGSVWPCALRIQCRLQVRGGRRQQRLLDLARSRRRTGRPCGPPVPGAVDSTSSSGTTWSPCPVRSASSAPYRLAPAASSPSRGRSRSASAASTTRRSPRSGRRSRRPSGTSPTCRPSRRSHAYANDAPAPAAMPFTAAITGFGMPVSARTIGL